ncbi:hypothetical protein [Ktedonobacter robiniae]|uniref:Uncharacterized protein n=1 Tax=Ktedonobacter robiniae TaxID=2778365 RepID=A0ABQ3V6B9_9CHLR|nr:hypothetical protein [Ktedonobacter robiniae]GHO60493.1 hypothetical protein KSB_89680 [Ktedonobacter robiniae]
MSQVIYQVVRSLALQGLEVLSGFYRLRLLVDQLSRMMQSGCRVNPRSTEPCLAQLLLNGLDWLLT